MKTTLKTTMVLAAKPVRQPVRYHRRMSHASPTGPAAGDTETSTPAAAPYPDHDDPPAGRGRWARWSRFVTPAVAVLAAALAIAAWFDPLHRSAPTYTPQQADAAKTKICAAYTTVHQGVVTNTHKPNPVPGNPAGALAVAANARLALLGGGAYLRDRLAGEPATPAELANAVTGLADTIEELGINYLAGASNQVQEPLRKTLDTQLAALDKLCT